MRDVALSLLFLFHLLGALSHIKTMKGVAYGIGKFFDLDRELITFDTPKDLIRKVRYYLSHDVEREQVIFTARKKLLAQQTVKQRAHRMLEIIRENIPT